LGHEAIGKRQCMKPSRRAQSDRSKCGGIGNAIIAGLDWFHSRRHRIIDDPCHDFSAMQFIVNVLV
jgi:hypothetical protein